MTAPTSPSKRCPRPQAAAGTEPVDVSGSKHRAEELVHRGIAVERNHHPFDVGAIVQIASNSRPGCNAASKKSSAKQSTEPSDTIDATTTAATHIHHQSGTSAGDHPTHRSEHRPIRFP